MAADSLSGCSDFVTFTALGISKPFKYISDCKWEFKMKYNDDLSGRLCCCSWKYGWCELRYIMVKHHILAVTLCTINRCKAVMGIGYSKFFGFTESSYSSFLPTIPCITFLARGLQRDVVYLGWPVAPSYMSPNAGGDRSRPMSTAVHITWHVAQINFGDLPPYLTYAFSDQTA